MTTGNAGGNKQEALSFDERRTHRALIDQTKEDGIRKELYENERKAQKNWQKKWGFLQNPKKLWDSEAQKAGLLVDADILNQRKAENNMQSVQETTKQKITLEGFPKLSSGMIGWRLFSEENNMILLGRSMYSSRKQTMNPPLSPDEPDLRNQRIIFLG